MRRLIAFPCDGETLVGTLDEADGTTGLLIVSGGNEIRAGAHRGMAMLAGRLAATGTPVFRFDRRGVGDSTGENRGYQSSLPDIAAAAAAFRQAAPHVSRLVGFGNCDGATALALFAAEAGIKALVLANPWIVEQLQGDPIPPAAAVRAHYARRLHDPVFWQKLARGRINLRSSVNGLRRIAHASRQPTELTRRFAEATHTVEVTVVLARGDSTAVTYADAMRHQPPRPTVTINTDSHSFARAGDAEALEAAIRSVLARQPTK